MLLLLIPLIILLLLLILFLISDKFLKPKTEKPAIKTEDKKDVPQPVVEEKPQPVSQLTIYNSELADDLDEMIKNEKKTDEARIKIGNHVDKENNISSYLKEKNYHAFNFDSVNASTTDSLESEDNFTAEDYKRVVALSNIIDKK